MTTTAKVWDARTGSPLARTERAHGRGRERVVQPRRHPHRHRQSWTGRRRSGTRGRDRRCSSSRGTRARCRCVSFSPDGSRIVTGSVDGTAKVWDARTGSALLDLKGHTGAVTSASFSPDGTRIVTGSDGRDGEGLGRADRHSSARTKRAHETVCLSVAFSPDGTRIVTGGGDSTAKVWDARTGTALVELKGKHDPNSRRVASRWWVAWRSAPTARASSPAVVTRGGLGTGGRGSLWTHPAICI